MGSALAQTEVGRALLPLGPSAVRRGAEILGRIDLVRVSDRILADAAKIMPAELRSHEAIHMATIRQLGVSITRVITYDKRIGSVVEGMGSDGPGSPLTRLAPGRAPN